MLMLVRHAMPDFSPDVDAVRWPLSAEGRAAARRLPLPGGALLVASDEVKGWQTLEHAGPVIQDSRFREVARVEPWDGPFRELRRSYVDGAALPDWERREDVAMRFEAGVVDFLVRAADRPLVVATHGMAMTVWLHARGCLRDPGEFWAGLRFPHLLAVDLDECRVWTVTP
jgi:broad specificity phosphatase PhoE